MALRRSGFSRALQSSPVDFGIANPVVPVEIWNQSGSNHYTVTGTLTLNGRPVQGATLTSNNYTIPKKTAEDGTFAVTGDKTILDRTVVAVKNLDGATLAGASLTEADQTSLMEAKTTVESAFVMTLDETPDLTAGATNVSISGLLTFADGSTPIPQLRLWGYELSGKVVDEQGSPIEGVYVSIRDDEGETWSLSSATDVSGRYALRFFPLGNAEFLIRIAEGADSYESLSEVMFDNETSAELDLQLNRTMHHIMGTGENGEFTVKAVPGAEYVGYMTGLAVGDTPIDATVTWPDAEGRFSISIPSVPEEGPLSFYQARFRFFTEHDMGPGTDITPDVIPEKLDPRIPSGLPPVIKVSP